MTFDKPMWPIRSMDGPMLFASVLPNEVIVEGPNWRRYCYIAVPSELFSFLAQMGHTPLALYLVSGPKESWIFGVCLTGDDHLDLWRYSRLPAWAKLFDR